jgi:hypothetical protein
MAETLEDLLSAAAVRRRARLMLDAGMEGRLTAFAVDLTRLAPTAAFVADTVRRNYPSLVVPPHARWRHLVVGGDDRWQRIARTLRVDRSELARIRFDLAVTSVLLDAGAGPEWRWSDPVSGKAVARSEGLALASLAAFASGLFSCDPARPLRADADRLASITSADMGRALQVAPGNRLLGLDGRTEIMRRLGAAVREHRALFGPSGRVGGLADTLARGGTIAAPDILTALLEGLGGIWINGLTVSGVHLGDTWRHDAIDVPGPTRGLMPLHKLSQWLAYSLIEPLQEAGVIVTSLDGLTGLAEYRNGGLFIDMGVIVPRDASLLSARLAPGDAAIVEWRALTVALLDEIAPLVRAALGTSAHEMPLAAVLEGGTWAAGRAIAKAKRADGSPPITIVSDGTVY